MTKGFNEGRVGMSYELTAEEKESRSHDAILRTLRAVVKAKRSLNGKKIKNIKMLFTLIDTDYSMTVDMIEFTEALTRLGLGLSEDAVIRLGKALDTDGGGTIDYKEFETWMKSGSVPKRDSFNVGVTSALTRFTDAAAGNVEKPKSLAEQAEQEVLKVQQEAEMAQKSTRLTQQATCRNCVAHFCVCKILKHVNWYCDAD